MNWSKCFGIRKLLMPVLIVFGALVTAYAQQEVDPTWYNPWGAPSAAQVQAAPKAARHSKRPKSKPSSASEHATKSHGKRTSEARQS